MKQFTWLKVFSSPFKRPKLRWYFGKIAIGVPYFYPRKWVKFTKEDAVRAAIKAANNPQLVKKSFNEWYSSYRKYRKAVPLTIGFSYCDLGWKTKWSDTDFRFEWNPILSFVFFGWQIAVWAQPEHDSHYWEAWLHYELKTDRGFDEKARVEQCKQGFPNIWKVSDKNGAKTVNYYDLILKKKYLETV